MRYCDRKCGSQRPRLRGLKDELSIYHHDTLLRKRKGRSKAAGQELTGGVMALGSERESESVGGGHSIIALLRVKHSQVASIYGCTKHLSASTQTEAL